MSDDSLIIQQRWQQGECRIEDGIFFGDGRVVLFVGDIGLREYKEVDIRTLVQEKPDYWTHIDAEVEQINLEHGIRVFAGGGVWEGEGFVAISQLSDGKLRWLLHLIDSEEFTEIEVRDNELLAVAEEYPERHEWIIPIDKPEDLRKVY